jgi:hypothetical protein
LLNKIAPSKYNESNKVQMLAEFKTLLQDKKYQAHNAIRLDGIESDSQDRKSSSKSKGINSIIPNP